MVLILAFFLSACSFLPKEEEVVAPPLAEPANIYYDTAEVKNSGIVKRLTGLATFVPVTSENVFYDQSGGQIDDIYIKEGDIVKKGDQLITLKSGNTENDIKQLEIELQKSELRIQQLVEQGADKYSVGIAELDKKSLELRLSQLNAQLNESKMVSPIDGMVSFVTDLKPGDRLEAFESIVRIADLSNLQLQYTAATAKSLTDVKLGMEVKILIGGEEYKGEVVQTPEDIPEDIAVNSDQYDKSLLIRLHELPNGISIGDSAEIEITLAKKEEVLVIPINGLRTMGNRNYVQVLENNSKREIDVEIGIISNTEVEVISGLNEGDQVILK